jgi:hypothetical protein
MKYTREEARIKATQYAYEIRHGRHTEQKEIMEFHDYMKECFDNIKADCGNLSFGNKVNGVFCLSQSDEPATIIRVKFAGQPYKFRTVASYKQEWEQWAAQFQPVTVTHVHFEECAGIA